MKNDEKAMPWNEENTAPSIILNLPNILLGKLTKKEKPISIWLSALILDAVIFLPFYTLALILGEHQQLKDIGWTVFSALQLTYISVIACYIALNLNILRNLKRKIIPYIELQKDATDLMRSIHYATSPKYSLIIILSIPIGVMIIIGGTLAYGKNPGLGLPLSAIFGSFFMGVVGYYFLWTLCITKQLGKFKFCMNEFTPGSTKVIYDIREMLNTHVYIMALFIMIVTIVNSLDKFTVWFVWVDILIGWTPIITQFFLTQSTLDEIVTNAKWEALEQIQTEIKTLKNKGELKDKETTDAINRLLDLHDRIQKVRNSTLDFTAGLNFLNQLMLPVIGWLIGNIEKLTSLIKLLLNITR